MIRYADAALRQVRTLIRHYESLGRDSAIRALARALSDAELRIERKPEAGLAAPRPYPQLVQPGRAWIKAGGYWVRYTTSRPPVILGVFYERTDIPRHTS